MSVRKLNPGLHSHREFLLDGVPVVRAYWFEKDTRSRVSLPLIVPETYEGERLVYLLGRNLPEIITDWKP